MRVVLTALFVLAAFQSPNGSAAAENEARSTKTMALTFDDLPYAAPAAGRNTVPHIRRVTDSILAVLEKYHAPATAFVNEAKLQVAGEFSARRALLQRWVDAGVILGNHTLSHVDLNSVSIAQFKQEIIKGEIVTRQLMKSRHPYQLYFRHPYTHTGDSEEKKEEIGRFLKNRGYKVAPHTIDSQDYVFNVIYLYAKEQGDVATANRICEVYWDFVIRATEFAENMSVQMFGGDIPQTIVLHANDLNANCLDELLARFKRKGYEFVSLDAATSDPAYKSQDTLVTAYGPSWLWRWMKSQDMNISFREDPELPDWVTTLSQQVSLETYREQ